MTMTADSSTRPQPTRSRDIEDFVTRAAALVPAAA